MADSAAGTRLAATGRITLIGALVNVVLTVLKAVAGVVGGSSAMLADAAHSLSDLISDGVTYYSSRVAAEPPDRDHPYGHGRFETIGTVVLAAILILAAIGIAFDAWTRFGEARVPGVIALWVAGISIVAKEILYRVTARVGAEHESPLTVANAWHHRTDALSSVAALAGIAGARMGFPILDPVAAIAVASMIVVAALKFTRGAIREVTDQAIQKEMLDELSAGIDELPGVRSIHQLRARQMGPNVLVDVHIEVDGATTVSDGHQVAERVRRFVEQRKRNITEVLVHVDPEPDEREPLQQFRPRAEIELDVREAAEGVEGVEGVSHVRVHFLGGAMSVQVDIIVDPEQQVREAASLARQVRRDIEAIEDVDRADVHLELEDHGHEDAPDALAPKGR